MDNKIDNKNRGKLGKRIVSIAIFILGIILLPSKTGILFTVLGAYFFIRSFRWHRESITTSEAPELTELEVNKATPSDVLSRKKSFWRYSFFGFKILDIVVAVALAFFFAWLIPRLEDIQTRADLNQNKNAVAQIATYDKDGNGLFLGSGEFIDSQGTFITNYHVIDGASSIIVILPEGATYSAIASDVIHCDRTADVAIIKFNATNTPHINKWGITKPKSGDDVVTIGYPGDIQVLTPPVPTVTAGKIGAIQTQLAEITLIQFSAPISPGNSGGGLFDSKGRLIGLTSGSLNNTENTDQNLNYAVPTSYIKNLLDGKSSQDIIQAEMYFAEGLRADSNGDYAKAAELFEQAVNIDNENEVAYKNLAGDYYELGNYDKEVQNYLQATKLKPEDADAWHWLGTAYVDINDSVSAKDAFNKALQLLPDDKDILYDAIPFYLSLGDKQGASKLIDSLAKVDEGLANMYREILQRQK
jgi:S1-C subfamily serine protease